MVITDRVIMKMKDKIEKVDAKVNQVKDSVAPHHPRHDHVGVLEEGAEAQAGQARPPPGRDQGPRREPSPQQPASALPSLLLFSPFLLPPCTCSALLCSSFLLLLCCFCIVSLHTSTSHLLFTLFELIFGNDI